MLRDHDLILPSRIFQARLGTIHLEHPPFGGGGVKNLS